MQGRAVDLLAWLPYTFSFIKQGTPLRNSSIPTKLGSSGALSSGSPTPARQFLYPESGSWVEWPKGHLELVHLNGDALKRPHGSF